MKTILFAIALLLPVTGTWAGDQPAAEWNNAFARDMLKTLSEEQPDENFAFSPFSISTALGMTYAGARGDTAAQIEEVFRFPGQEETHPDLASWAQAVQEAAQGHDTDFRLANRAWFQKGWHVKEDYLDVLETHYHAPLNFADFASQAEAERIRINDWVYEQTKEHIPDLLPPGSVNGLTRFVLVNALYFRGLWEFPFTDKTTDGSFYVGDNEVLTVPMMYGNRLRVWHLQTDLAKAIALKVEDTSYSLVIVLPNHIHGTNLQEAQAAIADGDFSLNVDDYSSTSMDVYLPRFRLEIDVPLKETLHEMGVVEAFNPGRADFSGISSGGNGLHIQDAFHSVFIDVHETGLEASGATAVVGGVINVPPTFHVNRPFLFFITENTTGTILFAGQIVRPEAPPEQDPSTQSHNYEEWKKQHFTEEQQSDPEISGPHATPHEDGVQNLLKYALGLGPAEPAEDSLPRPVILGDEDHPGFGLELVHDTNANVEWLLQSSTNLSKWEEVDFSMKTLQTLPGDQARVRFVCDPSQGLNDALFLRLQAALHQRELR